MGDGSAIGRALRALILNDLSWGAVTPAFAVVAAVGVLMVALNVRLMNAYD